MGQFVGCLKGIGEACRVLDFPVVSGNVSLYNETNGQGILPTPAIGGVGLLDDVTVNASVAFKREGEVVLLIGATAGWLGQSIYLRDVCGREEGAPPPVDLAVEKRNGDFVRQLIRSGQVKTVHDCSDGGIALALAEMAMAGGIGATVTALPEGLPLHAFLFGEDQGRYLLAVDEDAAADILYEAGAVGIPAVALGVTGGDSLNLANGQAISVKDLKAAHEAWLPDYMAGKA
jgi:phosphoribosylformylglycinamidine (FGAM) synthase-like enzyme